MVKISCGALPSGAVSFAGNTHEGINNKYIETKDLDGVAGQSFSVCMEVKKAEAGTGQTLFSMGQGTTRGGLFGYFQSDNTVAFGLYSDYTVTTSAYTSDVGVWVHWCFVFSSEGNTFAIYRHGVAQALTKAAADGTTSASGPLFLGVWKWWTNSNGYYYGPFSGAMDEVRVFERRALTQVEVSSLMTNPTTDALGLVLALTFDTGDLGKDSSCGGVGDAVSVTGLASVAGKECGSVDSSALIMCSR